MKNTKTSFIDEELAKPFALAAEGNPYSAPETPTYKHCIKCSPAL